MNTLNENLLRNLLYLRELAIASGNVKRLAELNIALAAHREVMEKENNAEIRG
jgi:hypothetical protein